MSSEGGAKAVAAALLANTGIAVLKLLAFLLTGASSMLAEAIHSVADSGNQGLLILGGRRAERAATANHPFGFGQERYLYSFIVAIVIFSVGGLFAFYEAYSKFEDVRAGQESELVEGGFWWVAVLVLLGAIVMEGLSFRTARNEANKVRGSLSLVGFVREAKSPEVPVILLEDFAALVGLTLALLGVGMTKLTGVGYWDVAGTAGIGMLLVLVAVVLAVETKSLLLGEAATAPAQERIRAALERVEGLGGVLDLRTMHLGPDDVLVGVRVAVARSSTGAEVARAIDRAEAAVRESEPAATVIYVEPDIERTERTERTDSPRPGADAE